MLLEMFWELVSGDGTVHSYYYLKCIESPQWRISNCHTVEYVEMKYVQLIYRNYNYFLALNLSLWVPCGLSPLVYVISKK